MPTYTNDITIRAEALSLLRDLPSSIAANIETRTRGKYLWKPHADCHADLRGSTVVLEFEESEYNSTHGTFFPTPAKATIIALEGASISLCHGTDRNKLHGKRSVRIHRTGARDIELRLTTHEAALAWHMALTRAAGAISTSMRDFRLISHLGEGSFGAVYVAEHLPTGENLALKVMYKKRSLKTVASIRCTADERILHEKLGGHPFVVKLRYAFETKKQFCLVFEICPGGSLYGFLNRVGGVRESRVRRIGAEVLLALEHLHTQGAVYRDLKPENVLLTADGHVRIADFGLSKILVKNRSATKLEPQRTEEASMSSEEELPEMKTTTACGTLAFTAPEVVSSVIYGQKVDIWSFGVFLYSIVTRDIPFKTVGMIKRARFSDINFSRWAFSDELKDLIWHLLQKNPRSRPDFDFIKNHSFFRGVDWDAVFNMEPHPDNIGIVGFDTDEGDTDGLDGFAYSPSVSAADKELPGYEFEAKADVPTATQYFSSGSE